MCEICLVNKADVTFWAVIEHHICDKCVQEAHKQEMSILQYYKIKVFAREGVHAI